MDTPEIEVRTVASPQELIAAQELLAETFPDHSGAAADSDETVAYRALYPEQADLMAIAANEAGETVGAALGWQSCAGARVILRGLAVHPSARQQGVASRLIALIERAATQRRAPGITLGSADEAVDFYLQMGYKAVLLVQFVAADADADEAVAAALTGPLVGYECLRRAYNGVPQLFVQVETVDKDLMRRIEQEVPGVSAGWVMGKDF